MTILTAIIGFLITIGLLVAIHEYGHFWVARKVGVKVLTYSLGFGKPLYTWVSKKDPDKTEYVLAAIPFGGFVRMLDKREMGDTIPEEEMHREFTSQVLWKRFAIVLAGPMANFAFAILAYGLMFMIGVKGVKPYIGEVIPETPAAIAGFQSYDRIQSINSQDVNSLSDTVLVLLDVYLKDKSSISFTVETESGEQQVRRLDLSGFNLLGDDGDHLEKIGLKPFHPARPRVHLVIDDSAAAAAGFLAEDRIISANGHEFKSYKEFSPFLQKNGEKPVEFLVEREGKNQTITLTPKLTMIDVEEDGKTVQKERLLAGFQLGGYITEPIRDKFFTVDRFSFLDSMQRGAHKTWQMSVITLKFFGRLVTGEASFKNVSGPLSIADYAGQTIVMGLSVFLGFLGVVSLSLGVMNLLPIPVLDGGHLMYYIIEFVKGSPVSEAVQDVGMKIGVAMVGAFMVLAFYNDILRIFSL